MDLFSATLLVDLSAAEVTAQLAESARTIDRDTVEARCRQLVAWGNLVPAVGDARVSTVAEYIRSRSRYQVSKLRGRLHREAVAILHASDGAREVARELLGQIVQSLERILQMHDRREIDAEALAGEVTTVFGNQRLFTDSVRDFYAYLAGILGRYDLGGEEYAQFKELLLMYIDLITADVNRHAPAVAHRVNLVITWALRPPGRDRWSAMMRQRADLGLVAHLTVHELQRAAGLTRPGEIIHTCENPQVLQRLAAAGVQHPVACMSGNPCPVTRRLLA